MTNTVPELQAGGELQTSIDRMEMLLARIPVFSEAAQQAQTIICRNEVELSELVPLLETEPSLAATVLRVANSSFYGFPRQIASIREACVVLGQHTLRNLIMAAAVLDILKTHATEKEQCLALSRHSAHTAIIARKLAKKTGQTGDIVYTAGLLHDIGGLFTCVLLPEEATAIRQLVETEHCSLEQAEQNILGFNHATLSGAIAQRWKLPPDIAKAVANHHDPNLLSSEIDILIHVADLISIWMKSGEPLEVLTARISPHIMDRLLPSEQAIADFLEECPLPDDPDLDALLRG